MVTVTWVIGTILAIDLLIVVGFVTLEVIDRRRVQREVNELNALWRTPSRTPIHRVGGGNVLQRERTRTVAGRLWGHPRLIGNIALGTGVVAMLALIVVAAVGGQLGTRGGVTASGPSPLGFAPDQRTAVRDPDSGTVARAIEQQLGQRRVDVLPSEDPAVSSPVGQAPVPATFAAHASSWRSIVLVWAPVPEATGYQIERRSDWDGPDGWSLIWESDNAETTFRDTGLESSTTYFYRVTALTPAGIPAPSDVISATTPVEPPVATSLLADATSSSTISLSWVDVLGETGYRIERAMPGSSKWTPIATTGADVTEYGDGGLIPETKYRYRVFSLNEGGDGPSSNPAQATTYEEPGGAIDPPPSDGDDPGGSGKGGKDGAQDASADDPVTDDEPVTDPSDASTEEASTEDADTQAGTRLDGLPPPDGPAAMSAR
jgi:hypothetical protein